MDNRVNSMGICFKPRCLWDHCAPIEFGLCTNYQWTFSKQNVALLRYQFNGRVKFQTYGYGGDIIFKKRGLPKMKYKDNVVCAVDCTKKPWELSVIFNGKEVCSHNVPMFPTFDYFFYIKTCQCPHSKVFSFL